MINLINITQSLSLRDILKHEIHEWVIKAAQLSGLHKDEDKAFQFAKEKVLDVFENASTKQHCFEIKTKAFGVVGRTWIIEKDNTAQPEMRIAYIKIDEPYQGKGFAGKAIGLIEEYGMQKGYYTFSLNVFGHLPHAARLYKKLDFKIAHEIIRDGQLITTEMIKTVPGSPKKYRIYSFNQGL